ncbi:MAG: hypothetical protein J7L32_05265 [Thermoplasmata archaeon]|nr:hypothetical protein [Thermoplasmata archaeon]
MQTQCELCKKRGKPAEYGSEVKCAFRDDGVFTKDNWNCATMNKLRDIALKLGHHIRNDSDWGSFGAVPFDDDKHSGFIVMTWYKSRGKTDLAIYVDDVETKPLTIEMAEAAISYWEERLKP